VRSGGYYVFTTLRCMSRCPVSERRAGRTSPLYTCCWWGIIWPRAVLSCLDILNKCNVSELNDWPTWCMHWMHTSYNMYAGIRSIQNINCLSVTVDAFDCGEVKRLYIFSVDVAQVLSCVTMRRWRSALKWAVNVVVCVAGRPWVSASLLFGLVLYSYTD